ncbi:uncharacterized protein LOC122244662 [Penaeus japonicus]|uniref:uncharacterized protein LOC122244662 n=1 Tax=Penaeus japonicus TaxID=27405 RepID=UPI001C7147E1|nr:uncharacterized protein LOC122244662 [Penaeus japonicus]
MPGRGTTDALRLLMEKYREGQQELLCEFIDLVKAYDRVPREEVWNCLRIKGVPESYVHLVQDMFEVKVGVHQGSALGPLVFAVIMDYLTEEVRRQSPWGIMDADDDVVCKNDRETIEEKLGQWTRALERRGMRVSRTKTKYLNAGYGMQRLKVSA